MGIELEALRNNFDVITDLEDLRPKDLVVSRFTQSPFTELLFEEIGNKQSYSFNSLDQVNYIEDARRWYKDLEGLTPRSWFSVEEALDEREGPFFVKGITNSRKDNWNEFSYAKDSKKPVFLVKFPFDETFSKSS